MTEDSHTYIIIMKSTKVQTFSKITTKINLTAIYAIFNSVSKLLIIVRYVIVTVVTGENL